MTTISSHYLSFFPPLPPPLPPLTPNLSPSPLTGNYKVRFWRHLHIRCVHPSLTITITNRKEREKKIGKKDRGEKKEIEYMCTVPMNVEVLRIIDATNNNN